MQQPQSKIQPAAVGEWTTGLWGCFSDWGNCITTLFCPCITYGQIANIVDQGKTSCFNGGKTYTIIMCSTFGCCLYSCFSRTKLRYMFNLPPSPCGCADCVVHSCCEPCALCQEYRELQNRGYNMAIGWDLNKTQVGAPISQMMTTQMAITNNHPNDPQNNRYDNKNDRGDNQNDHYNNQNDGRDGRNDRYNNQNNHRDGQNDRYNNQNRRDNQNDHYNNQNDGRDNQNDRYNNQNDRQSDRYSNQNDRQNDRYDNNQNDQHNDHQNDYQAEEY